MDKIIKAATEMMLEPYMQEVRIRYKEFLLASERQQGGIHKPESLILQETEKGCAEIKAFLMGEEEITRIEEGFEIVIRELEGFPNKEEVLENFKEAGNRLLNVQEDTEEDFDLPIFDTLQEMFEIKDETYQTIYQIATGLYDKQQTEEALNVFLLLTNLNNLVFEPWLGLGSCWLSINRYTEALQAFTVASLLNFNSPEPHLYAAECYLGLKKKTLAQQTLELALSLMDQNQQSSFKDHIDYIKNALKTKD